MTRNIDEKEYMSSGETLNFWDADIPRGFVGLVDRVATLTYGGYQSQRGPRQQR